MSELLTKHNKLCIDFKFILPCQTLNHICPCSTEKQIESVSVQIPDKVKSTNTVIDLLLLCSDQKEVRFTANCFGFKIQLFSWVQIGKIILKVKQVIHGLLQRFFQKVFERII